MVFYYENRWKRKLEERIYERKEEDIFNRYFNPHCNFNYIYIVSFRLYPKGIHL